MKKAKIKKAGAAVIAASTLTVGVAATVYAYRSDFGFDPLSSNRDLQLNQVVFENGQETLNSNDNQKSESGELLKNHQNGEEHLKLGSNTDYLFQNTSVAENGKQSELTDSNHPGDWISDTDDIYHIIQDKDQADIIIGGNPSVSPKPETGNSASGDGQEASKPDNEKKDDNQKDPVNPGDRNDHLGESDTLQKPADSIKIPEPEKPKQDDDFLQGKPFDESKIPSGPDINLDYDVVISEPFDADTDILYKGQKVDQKTIYYSLDTYVFINDNVFYWGKDDLDKYIRIDSVSFDGGQTWHNDFPLTIPSDIDNDSFYITVSYRFSTASEWTQVQIPYSLKANRVLVLSQKLKKEDVSVDPDTIMNYKSSQYLQDGQVLNLFGYSFAAQIIENGELSSLFPGWTENGKLVSWFYQPGSGCHILEPADRVPLSSSFTAKLKAYWAFSDCRFEDYLPFDERCYLQTLTGVNKQALRSYRGGNLLQRLFYSELSVPEYIQAIDIDSAGDVTVDYLSLPDTLCYIADSAGLHVNKGYKVDKDNLFYKASKEGALMNKSGTQMLAIPYQTKNLTIPDTVVSVNIFEDNQIRNLTLEATEASQIPSVSYQNLKNCTVRVPESLLDAFIIEEASVFTSGGNGNSVAIIGDQTGNSYTIKKGAVLSNSGSLHKLIPTQKKNIRLTSDIKKVERTAFDDAPNMETIIMPDKKSSLVTFEKGCLASASVKEIICFSDSQKKDVERQLKEQEITGVNVKLTSQSGGYTYTITTGEDGEDFYTLLQAPEHLKEFDGTILVDGTRITVNSIADYAFAEQKELQWVILPEATKRIGYQAFYGCDALQGVLMDSRDQITIADQAFDNCGAIRFVASNAMECTMEDNYAPVIDDRYSNGAVKNSYFFAPTGSSGYAPNALSFSENSMIDSYQLVQIDENTKILYGASASAGADDQGSSDIPWLALRSGTNIPQELALPDTTVEIFAYAFADAGKEPFTISWDTLPNLQQIDSNAFRDSALTGALSLKHSAIHVADYAFSGTQIQSVSISGSAIDTGYDVFQNCKNLTEVTLGTYKTYGALAAGSFTGCDNLKQIEFLDPQGTDLSLYYMGVKFQLNYNWPEGKQNERENVKIIIPEGSMDAYVKKWRYRFGGYADTSTDSAYQSLCYDVEMDLTEFIDDEPYIIQPTIEEIEAEAKKRLTEMENEVRTFLSGDSVTEPSDFYPYRIDPFFGTITLVGAPSAAEEMILCGRTLELPDGWTVDYIGSDAFIHTPNMKKITVTEHLEGIYAGAFRGIENDLTLHFTEDALDDIELIKDSASETFDFGIDDKKLHVTVDGTEEQKQALIDFWTLRLADYDSFENVPEEQAEALRICMNRVRGWFGMPELSDISMYLNKEKETEKEVETETDDMTDAGTSADNQSGEGTEQ